jgi:site-specific DNA-methyltransferase (adenine-specific)
MGVEGVNVALHLGDCLEYMKGMKAGSVDAILTDIPYGTTSCAWDEVLPFDEMWAGVKHVLKPRGVFVTTASQPFTSKLVMSNLEWFKYEWIWNKVVPSNFQMANYRPLKSHENILVFSQSPSVYTKNKTAANYYPIMIKTKAENIRPKKNGRLKQNIMRIRSNNKIHKTPKGISFPKTIIKRNRFYKECNPTNRVHPSQKPVFLYEYLIKTYTKENHTILDICMGSGTTGVAAVQLGRNFIGCEIDPNYFDIAQKRIKEAQMQLRLEI